MINMAISFCSGKSISKPWCVEYLKVCFQIALLLVGLISTGVVFSEPSKSNKTKSNSGLYSYVAPYVENGEIFTSPILTSPNQVAMLGDFGPTVDGVVLLVYWSLLCPRKEECNFKVIDSAIELLSNKGKKIALNIVTVGYPILMSKNYSGKIENATPTWIMEETIGFNRKTTVIERGVYKKSTWKFPYYRDKYFQEESLKLIKLLGEKYNNNSNISFVRIGTGVVGEENPSTNGKNTEIPSFTNKEWYGYVKKISNSYIKSFPDKELELDIVWAGWVQKYGTPKDNIILNEFLQYLGEKNIVLGFNGMRASSIDEYSNGDSPHANNLRILSKYKKAGKSVSLEGYGPPWEESMMPYKNLVEIICEIKPLRVNYFGSVYQFAGLNMNSEENVNKPATEILARNKIKDELMVKMRSKELNNSLNEMKACLTD